MWMPQTLQLPTPPAGGICPVAGLALCPGIGLQRTGSGESGERKQLSLFGRDPARRQTVFGGRGDCRAWTEARSMLKRRSRCALILCLQASGSCSFSFIAYTVSQAVGSVWLLET